MIFYVFIRMILSGGNLARRLPRSVIGSDSFFFLFSFFFFYSTLPWKEFLGN